MSGLKSLAESGAEGIQKSSQVFMVDPKIIEVQAGFNARPIDKEHVQSIKSAYLSGAILPPLYIRVDSSTLILVDGHHRLMAMLELITEGHEIKRCQVIQFRGSDADRITLMLTTAQGKPLTPLQMGMQYSKLINFGWEIQEISNKVGKTYQHVKQMIELTESDIEIQDMVNKGEVAAHLALKTVKKYGDSAGEVLKKNIKKAKNNGKEKVTAKLMGEYSLAAALQAEIDSNGKILAESLCQKHTDLIINFRDYIKLLLNNSDE